uniref:fibronectin type III domain-containing protein n=1 Tax=Winogradskyella sp. TaxID=1883156 RepID=UPI003F6A9E06
MKKITFLILLIFSFIGYAQVLNQPANWPNASWTITGTYDTNPNVFTDNPTLSSNFSFDDDEPGSTSDNDVAAESPIINLTAAFNAGEFGIELTSTYVLNTYENETITIQYWDADSNNWVNWSNSFNDNTPNAPNVNFCAGPSASFNSGTLNITAFSANQLANFRYRIYYEDNGSWGWGFCFNSPTISSGAAPTCPTVSNLFVNNITTNTANVYWTPNGTETLWEIAIQPAGTGIPTSGTLTINTAPHSATGLTIDTAYEIYVRARCAASDYSSWAGPINFSTSPPSRINFSQVDISLSGYDMAVVDMNGDFLDDIVGVSAS